MEGDIGHGKDGFAQAAVRSVADHANDAIAAAALWEGLLQGTAAVEKFAHEGFVDDGDAGRRVVRAKILAVDEGDLHGVHPTGRDGQKVGEYGAGRRAVDRDKAVPTIRSEQRPSGARDSLDAGYGAQMLRH